MHDPVSVVVPARDEAATIGNVVTTLSAMQGVAEVVVVDNASADDTAAVAAAAGARTVREDRPGMGHAVRTGFLAARQDWVMKVDADLDRFDTALFARMIKARGPDIGLVKGRWQDPGDNMPMTRLLVMPSIRQIFPGLAHLQAPNSGIYVANRRLIAMQELVGSYAADLDVMLRIHAAGAEVAEVDIGRIEHDSRDLGHYNAMAEVILAFFLHQNKAQITGETVVMAHDGEQVIEYVLGTAAARARSGAVITVYLDEVEGVAADALRAALAPFPTAAVLPLSGVGAFVPRSSARSLRLFAPYPAAHEDRAIRAALHMQAAMPGGLSSDLLLMPLNADRGAVGAFRTDVALEIGTGADIKRTALQAIAPGEAGDLRAAPRELFQSFASLPDPLKSALSTELRGEAGNM